MTRPGRDSDAGLIALFLDMLAAERGAGTNTLAAYARDLEDFSAHLSAGKGATRRTVANATTDDVRGFLPRSANAVLPPPRWRGGFRQSASSIASSTRKGTAATIPPRSSKDPSAAAHCRKCSASRRSTTCWQLRAPRWRASGRCRSGCARRGSPAFWSLSTPPGCAFPNWWRCQPRRRSAMRACWWCAARAARNGWCRSTTPPNAR